MSKSKTRIRFVRRDNAGLSEVELHFLDLLLSVTPSQDARQIRRQLGKAWLTKDSDQFHEYHLLPGEQAIRPAYARELIAPICGCRYQTLQGGGLCELVLRNGRLRSLEFSGPVTEVGSVVVTEVRAYAEVDRRFRPITPELLAIVPNDIQR